MISYPAVLDCPWELFWWVVKLLTAHRKILGTRRGVRVLSSYMQAKMVLRRLRDRPDLASLARDFGVSLATAQRYCAEGIKVLADQAPDLQDLIKRAADEGWAYTIVDGTLIPGYRVASKADKYREAAKLAEIRGEPVPESARKQISEEDLAVDPDDQVTDKPLSKTKIDLMKNACRADWYNDPTYSGKHHDHGMNIQVASGPSGKAAYISEATAGRVYDSKAAEAAGLPGALAQTDRATLADLAYISIDGWQTPIKKKKGGELTDAEHQHNRSFSKRRCAIERGMWLLKGHWRILQFNPGNPSETAELARACLVLNHFLDGSFRTPLRHAA